MGHGTVEIKTRGKRWLDRNVSCQARFEFFDHTSCGKKPCGWVSAPTWISLWITTPSLPRYGQSSRSPRELTPG